MISAERRSFLVTEFSIQAKRFGLLDASFKTKQRDSTSLQLGFKMLHDRPGQSPAAELIAYENSFYFGIISIVLHNLGGATGDQLAIDAATDKEDIGALQISVTFEVITLGRIKVDIKRIGCDDQLLHFLGIRVEVFDLHVRYFY